MAGPIPEPWAATQPFFEAKGWRPFPFQTEVWGAYLSGKSGLLHSATGTGKTLAVWLGPVIESLGEARQPGIKVLWLTPLRALAGDTWGSLLEPLAAMGSDWRVEVRTGDTASSAKAKQDKNPPEALITTPESLSILLSRASAQETLSGLRLVVVDEWHELLSTKRGVQTELCLARLARWNPNLRIWGVSATLGNVETAMQALTGARPSVLIEGERAKEVVIDTLVPDRIDRFPWAGHLGSRMIPRVVDELEGARSALVFTNVRSSAEIWHQSILRLRPDWAEVVGLHHGSVDREQRFHTEDGLREGKLRAVVCTSSLDLGVDFSPVERVMQVGSPKGAARLLQRAGRSGHQPGAVSRATCVPTHALELLEFAAARRAISLGRLEARPPLRAPLDVLAQHLVTLALGGGFRPEEAYEEVRQAYSYRDLTRQEFEWVLDYITTGGHALRAYDEYKKVVVEDGVCHVREARTAQRHRMAIGTIVSESAIQVQFLNGTKLGTVEEGFISSLRPKQSFAFAGHILELVRVEGMVAYVRRSKAAKAAIPKWAGGRVPLSNELAQTLREVIEMARDGESAGPDVAELAPLLALQAEWSLLPRADELLIESVETKEGCHVFVFPFEGRLVHQGLAALLAFRLTQRQATTITMASNDYGFELLAPTALDLRPETLPELLDEDSLSEDILSSLNASEMAKRQFREIARIAGLVFTGYPTQQKTTRQVQTSTGLMYDVFAKYDPENLLLAQARREVLERELEQTRLRVTLARMRGCTWTFTHPPHPTPFAFPIMVDRLREAISSEDVADRIERMALRLEDAAGTRG